MSQLIGHPYRESSLIANFKTAAGLEIRFCTNNNHLKIFVAIDELDDALVH